MCFLFRGLLIFCLVLQGWGAAHAQDECPGIPVLVYHEITTDEARQPGNTVIPRPGQSWTKAVFRRGRSK